MLRILVARAQCRAGAKAPQWNIEFYLLLGVIALGALLPLYRAEYGLGFVLGMTFTFGAVLPMLVSAVLMAISAAIHLGVRPLLLRLVRPVSRRLQ